MRVFGLQIAVATALFASSAVSFAQPAQTSKAPVEATLQNILNLDRPGQDGYATIWDGNKYVQCKRLPDRGLRCEAAGVLMQPSLERVLTPERVSQLAALGWRLDPSFGNYVQTFPAGITTTAVAEKILQVLVTAYDADIANLEVQSRWVKSELCPPRNGPTQNLAGMVNDAPSMAATAVYACAYKPKENAGPNLPLGSTAELIDFYGVKVTSEVQRLRVNVDRHVYAIFEAGIGYVQCKPDARPPSIYCEAQSAESWDALASILTPDRVARLHAAGFADPGRGPNYWKIYQLDQIDDAGIAGEIMSILHDVYGYNGLPALKVKTE
jgi:hypothetical protein